jgi:hypothetical protein
VIKIERNAANSLASFMLYRKRETCWMPREIDEIVIHWKIEDVIIPTQDSSFN